MARHVRQVFLALLVPASLYAGLCLLVFLTQRSQIYYPVRESAAPGATPMLFARDGAEIKVWTVERPGPAALLYFGGNAEDVGASIGLFARRLPRSFALFRQLPRLRWKHRPSVRGRTRARRRRPV